MTKTKLSWGLVLVLAVAGTLYMGLTQARAAKPSAKVDKKVDVITGAVERHHIAPSLQLIGTLTAAQSASLSFKELAPIAKLMVLTNTQVNQNQVLVQLDDSQAQAALIEAQAVLEEEQRKLNEFSRIISRGAVTQTELDAQRASVNVAKARLTAAKAAVQDHQLKAPFAGTLGIIDLNLGEMVAVGTPVLHLDNLATMQLDLYVPERYLSSISQGMAIKAQAKAWPSQTFEGKVTAVDSRVDPDTLNIRVQVEFNNPEQRLKPGMLLTALMQFPQQSQAIIPVQALEYSGTHRFVYRITPQGIAERVQVTLGQRIDNSVVIEQGVMVGDKIVVQGLVNMRDGLSVNELQVKAS
ncbi:efflux RND transporter periplasmic adaptor subunit [Motilimonas pumila]|uniref:Efflux RND transporter periplasmic adaptor subunit n=1 Tax=Motilimonas pumila TaxID=2303987 RepID=A0A418YBD5_9GAMM|nr:efflux RND transporter periplasmic adaptor subunit [Motilimonas pumila]RJG40291.1 efflux RND transporter periplasmic adaptor subunit [Motilimonas pumila]